MKYSVAILRQARADADQIYDWIAEHAPPGAERWYTAFTEAADSLRDGALGCSLAPEAASLNYEVRQCFFRTRRGKTYRLVFTIAGDHVQILRVRGPGQRPLRADELSGA